MVSEATTPEEAANLISLAAEAFIDGAIGRDEFYRLTNQHMKAVMADPPLPTEPGIYTVADTRKEQERLGEWHTDGVKVCLLNTSGNWVDLGWGQPDESDGPFTRMTSETESMKTILDVFRKTVPVYMTKSDVEIIARKFKISDGGL